MKQNLLKAKFALTLAKGITTNAELVLSEILDIEEVRKPNSPKSLSDIIPNKLEMSISMYRKIISELYQNDLLIKKNGLISINRKYIVI